MNGPDIFILCSRADHAVRQHSHLLRLRWATGGSATALWAAPENCQFEGRFALRWSKATFETRRLAGSRPPSRPLAFFLGSKASAATSLPTCSRPPIYKIQLVGPTPSTPTQHCSGKRSPRLLLSVRSHEAPLPERSASSLALSDEAALTALREPCRDHLTSQRM